MKHKARFLKILLLLTAIIAILPISKAKFIYSNSYDFSITTKATKLASNAFAYTGKSQNYVTPLSGYYAIQIWGADGGNSSQNNLGGLGDYFSVLGYLDKNVNLEIKIGGAGVDGKGSKGGAGGYNGGGNSSSGGWGAVNSGGGGGGATSIYTNQILALVAGGGGGAGSSNYGTDGGSVSEEFFSNFANGSFSGFYRAGLAGVGIDNTVGSDFSGQGATTSGGKTYAISGFGSSQGKDGGKYNGGNGGNWSGGGGGGLYGGGGGSSNNKIAGGGGAGSSFYLDSFSDALSPMILDELPSKEEFTGNPYREKYGYAIITFIGSNIPE